MERPLDETLWTKTLLRHLFAVGRGQVAQHFQALDSSGVHCEHSQPLPPGWMRGLNAVAAGVEVVCEWHMLLSWGELGSQREGLGGGRGCRARRRGPPLD